MSEQGVPEAEESQGLELNPQYVIQTLSEQVASLTTDLAVWRAATRQAQENLTEALGEVGNLRAALATEKQNSVSNKAEASVSTKDTSDNSSA